MNHLFNKMFRPVKNSSTQCVLPSLPPDLTRNNVKKKAMIGWIARRVGQLLPLELKETDVLFYIAFSYCPESKGGNETDDILYLAELLVRWAEKDENVLANIKDMMLPSKLETCLLQAYEECRENLSDKTSKGTVDLDNNLNQSNVTKTTLNESDWNERVWQVYRDVMYAATQRKFLLISDQEVQLYMNGNIHLEEEVKERADITKCRENANKVFLKLGYDPSKIMSRLLLISEAVTNILRHAEYGKMFLVEDDQDVRVIIQDRGPGFSMKDLPNTILLAGYSTRKSLGQGFTLMLKMSDQVLLSTSSKGSTIILVFNKKGDKE